MMFKKILVAVFIQGYNICMKLQYVLKKLYISGWYISLFQEPHAHKHSGLAAHENFCRNPLGKLKAPW